MKTTATTAAAFLIALIATSADAAGCRGKAKLRDECREPVVDPTPQPEPPAPEPEKPKKEPEPEPTPTPNDPPKVDKPRTPPVDRDTGRDRDKTLPKISVWSPYPHNVFDQNKYGPGNGAMSSGRRCTVKVGQKTNKGKPWTREALQSYCDARAAALFARLK